MPRVTENLMQKLVTLVAIAASLTACGGTTIDLTPPVEVPRVTTAPNDGAVNLVNGTYSVTQNGATYALPGSGIDFNGQRAWVSSNATRGASYTNTGVLALAGIQTDGTSFSGVTSTPVSPPIGNATYPATFTILAKDNTFLSSRSYQTSLNFNVAQQRLSVNYTQTNFNGSRDTIEMDAGLFQDEISGTVTVNGTVSDMKGGFYSGDVVAGAFNGSNMAGVFHTPDQ
jgi:hypothetical protein